MKISAAGICKTCVTYRRTDVIFPDDKMKMSKHVGVQIIH